MLDVSIIARVFPVKLQGCNLLLESSGEDDLQLVVKLLPLVLVNLLNTDLVVLGHGDQAQLQFNVTCLDHVGSLDIEFVAGFHLLDSGLEPFTLKVVGVSLSGVGDCLVVLNANLLEEVFDSLGDCE